MKYATLVLLAAFAATIPAARLVGANDDVEQEAEDKAKKAVDPTGSWRLEYEWNGAKVKDTYRLRQGKDGKVAGTLHRNETVRPIENGKIIGDKLSFSTSREREGVTWTVRYEGRIKGDQIEGTAVIKGGDQKYDFPWKPTRSVMLDDVEGVWNFKIAMQDGTVLTPTLTITEKGGKHGAEYVSQQGQKLEVKKLRVEKGQLRFSIAADLNGNKLKVSYRGRPRGDEIKGQLEYELGDNSGELDFSAKRKVKQEKGEKSEKGDSKDGKDGAAEPKEQSGAVREKSGLIGRRVPDFVLPDVAGDPKALSDFSDAEFVVLVFMGTSCPIGNAYVPELNALQERYAARGVQVIGVNSNLSDSAKDILKHSKEFKVEFPVLVDDEQLAADLVGAQRTPEVYVLDRRRHIRYRGRIDDRIGYDFKRAKSRRADLEEAIKQMIDGEEVSVAETKVEGCLITRKATLRPKGEVTYAKQVSRILHKRCASCHHPGTAAPFSLLSYENAREWSETIKETVVQRRMPPWNADPRYGKFSNDLRMPKEEIDTLVAWIDEGAPFGDKKDLPQLPQFAEGWTIGKPDIVFQMPEEFTVQASGAVEYQYFVTPTNFTEDVWVKASEPRPGNRAVVHHIIVFVRPKGSKSFRNLPAVGGFAPGEEPIIWPNDIGFLVPAGAELVWQVHYTPIGKVEKDRSEIGLVLYKKPPKRRVKGGGVFNFSFNIPPNDGNYQVVSQKTFKRDLELLALMPHMHLRGKSFRYVVRLPDGRDEILLNVPDYDFNWQHRYRFTKPYFLPKGSVLKCVAHFDNSPENPANPNPEKTVKWGDQTYEEMMIGWYSAVDAEPQQKKP